MTVMAIGARDLFESGRYEVVALDNPKRQLLQNFI
jgi:hypothetical protein